MAGLADLLKGDVGKLLEGQVGARLESATEATRSLEVAIREDIRSRDASAAALRDNTEALRAFHAELTRRA